MNKDYFSRELAEINNMVKEHHNCRNRRTFRHNFKDKAIALWGSEVKIVKDPNYEVCCGCDTYIYPQFKLEFKGEDSINVLLKLKKFIDEQLRYARLYAALTDIRGANKIDILRGIASKYNKIFRKTSACRYGNCSVEEREEEVEKIIKYLKKSYKEVAVHPSVFNTEVHWDKQKYPELFKGFDGRDEYATYYANYPSAEPSKEGWEGQQEKNAQLLAKLNSEEEEEIINNFHLEKQLINDWRVADRYRFTYLLSLIGVNEVISFIKNSKEGSFSKEVLELAK